MTMRLGTAFALVLAIAATATAGNGSRKVIGFTAGPDAEVVEENVDGVGVISFSKGNSLFSVHVVITDLAPDTNYEFQAFGLGGSLLLTRGTIETNSAGNGQGKASEVGEAIFVDVVDSVRIYRVGEPDSNPVAESTALSN